jgi:hypothetical protein
MDLIEDTFGFTSHDFVDHHDTELTELLQTGHVDFTCPNTGKRYKLFMTIEPCQD